jgi:hypothetical protein
VWEKGLSSTVHVILQLIRGYAQPLLTGREREVFSISTGSFIGEGMSMVPELASTVQALMVNQKE